MEEKSLSRWLKERCEREHLTLRQAGAKTSLSHSTIDGVIKGGHPSAETIRKLAQGFGRDGINQRVALEDHLLVLAGYRTERPEGEEPSEELGRLMDKLKQLNEAQVKMVTRFVDFLIEIDWGRK